MSLRSLRSVGCSMAGPRDPKALEQLERFRRRTALPAQRTDEAGWPQNNPSSALEQLRRAAEVARLTEQQNQEMQARGQELASRACSRDGRPASAGCISQSADPGRGAAEA